MELLRKRKYHVMERVLLRKREYRAGCRTIPTSLMSREMYLELFGIPPEEIFTPEVLQRIVKLVQRERRCLI